MTIEETAAEKRARLRKMKILSNSEKRMNRIFGVNSEPVTSSVSSPINCDNESNSHHHYHQSNASLTNDVNIKNENHDEVIQDLNPEAGGGKIDNRDIKEKPQASILPPRNNEPFPRKVSLISSPIHYKTLQLSQNYNSMLNHPNIINNLRLNSSSKFMFLLVLFALIGSCLNANILMLFISYLSLKHTYNGFYRNIWFDINMNVFKELITFIFFYIIIQVLVSVAFT